MVDSNKNLLGYFDTGDSVNKASIGSYSCTEFAWSATYLSLLAKQYWQELDVEGSGSSVRRLLSRKGRGKGKGKGEERKRKGKEKERDPSILFVRYRRLRALELNAQSDA